MNLMDYLLTILVFSPLLGVLALCFVNKQKAGVIKSIGIIASLIPLLLSLVLFVAFDFNAEGYQFEHSFTWIEFSVQSGTEQYLQIPYELGVDGLAVSLILLTAVIGLLAALASIYIKKRWKEYFILFFLLQVGMFGVFMSMNLFLFFIFFELTIIPTYFLIGIWGFLKKEKAANTFLIYNGIGSAIMLIAFVALFMTTGTMNIQALTMLVNDIPLLSEGFKLGVFVALLIAFGIKLPIFPLHTWMLKVHVQAPPAIVMIHSGVLLKLGGYGLMRIGVGVFPEQVTAAAFFLAILGVINILYGAVLAFVQKDLKMVLAYSSISHMGIVLLGIAALNYSGLQGAVFQMISHGLISALLFFIIGIIYERTKTTMIPELGGLAKSMPFISGILLAAAMANLGLPGMSGFVSEFLAFLGLFETMPIVAAVGVLGIILTAVYLLRAVLNTTFGPTKEGLGALPDAKGFEVIPMVVLLGLIILIGVYPSILSETLDVSVQTILSRIGG
ncbi:complex I subunit 4 family protein [Bacillus horti]|uniref:NADH-quinone oxidoreductase subunit M n=1 Tax=Caldalkalibacillus horti TaxID=77523 RepID=A0ABT9W0Q3_9BACI|nr:NADH-quinone oxidoreductase subunit M [Bacillus horti]MDQ0166440.1 NADH-quinone oxidoreductase subunit M [Bacillus horti]